MLKFNPITLDDKDWITEYYKKRNSGAATYSFAVNYTWNHAYPTEVCEMDNMFFVKTKIGENYSFLCPMGDGDFKNAINRLTQYCKENSFTLRIHGILEEDKQKFTEIFGDNLEFKGSRDGAEYVYLREDLAELKGKKYHAKRNHINRFFETPWSYERITKDNIGECEEMLRQWCRLNSCLEDESKADEGCAAMKTLKHFFDLDLKGALLRQNGKVVAYTIGEDIGNSTFAVHFEKAFSDVQGAYPAINQLFVKNETEGFKYINREEDVGSEGLRKAKLSYHPVFLLEKFRIVLEELK